MQHIVRAKTIFFLSFYDPSDEKNLSGMKKVFAGNWQVWSRGERRTNRKLWQSRKLKRQSWVERWTTKKVTFKILVDRRAKLNFHWINSITKRNFFSSFTFPSTFYREQFSHPVVERNCEYFMWENHLILDECMYLLLMMFWLINY